MTGTIISFPGSRDIGSMTDEDRNVILLEAHAALTDALLEDQLPDGSCPVILSIDEVAELMQLVEQAVGPEHFDDGLMD